MIPTMSKPLAGIIAIVVNAVVTGLVLAIIKKDVTEKDMEALVEKEEEEINLEDIQIFLNKMKSATKLMQFILPVRDVSTSEYNELEKFSKTSTK